jgi:hypothetical protein
MCFVAASAEPAGTRRERPWTPNRARGSRTRRPSAGTSGTDPPPAPPRKTHGKVSLRATSLRDCPVFALGGGRGNGQHVQRRHFARGATSRRKWPNSFFLDLNEPRASRPKFPLCFSPFLFPFVFPFFFSLFLLPASFFVLLAAREAPLSCCFFPLPADVAWLWQRLAGLRLGELRGPE